MRLLRYPGGKAAISGWIISQLPVHHTYVEPFGGGAAILLNKQRSVVEVYNDMDLALYRLFRVMRDKPEALQAMLDTTLYSRSEFIAAITTLRESRQGVPHDDLRVAHAMYVMLNQAVVGSTMRTPGSWSKSKTYTDPVDSWHSLRAGLPQVAARLDSIYVECVDALQCMEQWDSPETLHYVDPPYLADLRQRKNIYHIEFRELDEHARLVDWLLRLDGMVALSGYDHEVYDPLLHAGWQRRAVTTTTPMTSPKQVTGVDVRRLGDRIESLWLNPQAIANSNPTLF